MLDQIERLRVLFEWLHRHKIRAVSFTAIQGVETIAVLIDSRDWRRLCEKADARNDIVVTLRRNGIQLTPTTPRL